MSKFCRGATGVVACLHHQGVEHTLGLGYRRIPAKTGPKTRRGKRGQTSFTTPAKYNREPRHTTYANAKRSSIRNQRNKNRLIWTYGREDMAETVRRGTDRLEYAFCSEKTYFGLLAVENTPSSGGSVFRA